MITEGLAREIYHVSNFFNTPVKCTLEYLDKKIEVEVFSRYIKIFYKGQKIWEECMDEEIGNFGIESIQHIFLIIDRAEKGEKWEDLIYSEKSEDLNKFYKDEALKIREEIIKFSEADASQNNDNRTKQGQT